MAQVYLDMLENKARRYPALSSGTPLPIQSAVIADHNASRAWNHNALRHLTCSTGKSLLYVISIFSGNGVLGKLTPKWLGKKAQQPLPVDMVVSVVVSMVVSVVFRT